MIDASKLKLNIPSTNNEFKTVRFSMVGINATNAEDFVAIPNLSSTGSQYNTETKENMFYGDAGKSKRKASHSPSVTAEFAFSKTSEEHKKLMEFARGLGEEGMTQIEADAYDGYTVSFVANVECESFGPNGAPDDDATVSITFSYALGPILFTETENVEGEE